MVKLFEFAVDLGQLPENRKEENGDDEQQELEDHLPALADKKV